jgi:hypothetical protein
MKKLNVLLAIILGWHAQTFAAEVAVLNSIIEDPSSLELIYFLFTFTILEKRNSAVTLLIFISLYKLL